MAVYKRGKVWWFKFAFNGEQFRESTKQTNKRVAEQIEAARKTGLAKGDVGIRDRAPVPTLKDFAEPDFSPYVESRFQNKPKTLEYYKSGLKNLTKYPPFAGCTLDAITAEKIAGFIAKRREAKLAVSTINRQLEVLRRMLKLAVEWGKVEKALPKIEMLPGENHRDRVLSEDEESRYLDAAKAIGEDIQECYRRALEGIRAVMRGKQPIEPTDPFLLRDAATILADCALRPEECFRLRWEHVRDGGLHIPFGKTENARRTIPLTQRAAALIEMRRAERGEWIFPAPTSSGHIEKSSLKKQHAKACKLAKVSAFPLYTFRHTCITRWAAYMDPYTLGYLAGHSDFATTRRYVHPQAHTIMEAIERARNAQSGHKIGHKEETAVESPKPSTAAIH
jgi:integrase